MTKKANPKTAPAAESMGPTSDLPFAERLCDLPYLDIIKNRRNRWVEKLCDKRGDDFAPDVAFASDVALFAHRVEQVQTLLVVMEDYFELARRGGKPGGAGASVCYARAMDLLALARELVEHAGLDADQALETFCTAD